ncbi:hypothetical protein CN109_02935, partial [Sinorhizobium meliloti]
MLMNNPPVIEVENLAIALPGDGDRGFAVDHISLSVAAGVALVMSRPSKRMRPSGFEKTFG